MIQQKEEEIEYKLRMLHRYTDKMLREIETRVSSLTLAHIRAIIEILKSLKTAAPHN